MFNLPSGIRGVRIEVWQGYTGVWWWRLADKHGALSLDRGVSGQADSKQAALDMAKQTVTRYKRGRF